MRFFFYAAYFLANLYCFWAINWAIVNHYLRIVPLILNFILLIRWFEGLRRAPWLPAQTPTGIGMAVLSVLLVLPPGYLAYRAYQSTNLNNIQIVPLLADAPLRTGLYVVANGGNGLNGLGLNNYYNNWLGTPTGEGETMLFAVDIMEIEALGWPSQGILPADFRSYTIFEELVYSPCFGTVVFVKDDLPEIKPLAPGNDSLGNRVVIQCEEFYITLANLRRGSAAVEVGEQISIQRIVARVGNTADRSIPSLHMHVTTGGWDGTGEAAPILFLDGTGYKFDFFSRNYIFVR
jgi:hypothetical protein